MYIIYTHIVNYVHTTYLGTQLSIQHVRKISPNL